MTECLEYFDQKLVRARTPKTCCECRTVIHPRTTYSRVTGKIDGTWERHVRCMDCETLAREIEDRNNLQWEDVIAFGGLAEEIANMSDASTEYAGVFQFRQRRYPEVKG